LSGNIRANDLLMPISKKIAKRPAARRKLGKKAATSPEWKLRRAGGMRIVEAPELLRLNWLVHGFSTRTGGEQQTATNF